MFKIIDDKKIYVLSNTICVDSVGIQQYKDGKVYNPDTRKFDKEFVSLRDKEIELSRKYIRLCGNTKTYQCNSYGLKHNVEDFYRAAGTPEYIGNGNFIVALILQDRKFFLMESVSLFTYKKISIKSLKMPKRYLSYNVVTRIKPIK